MAFLPLLTRNLPALAWLVLSLTNQAEAQAIVEISLSRPSAVAAEGLLHITGIRELSDGRVIVLDAGDTRIVQLSADLSRSQQIGRPGRGPDEYSLPRALFSLAADTTAVLDTGIGRLLVISPTGRPIATREARGGTPCSASSPVVMRLTNPSTADALGQLYSVANAVRVAANGTLTPADSAAIVRWGSGCGRDTLAYLPNYLGLDAMIAGGVLVGRPGSVDRKPFRSEAIWAVSPDGKKLAIAWPTPYRVEIFELGNRRIKGPLVQYDPIPVTAADRAAWVEAQRQQVATVMTNNAQRSTVSSRMPDLIADPKNFPSHLPAFVVNARIFFSGNNQVWIERAESATKGNRYDVFDSNARLIGSLKLSSERRLIGFGLNSLYLVFTGLDDMEYLERYHLP